MSSLASLVVIAKTPAPGAVKTRLTALITPEDAAHVALACLQDTLMTLDTVGCEHRVLLLAGPAGQWVPTGWRVEPQVEGSLDHRLATGLAKLPAGPAVLVGMDTPQLRPDDIRFDAGRYDACLGMAADGGFWAIGFADPSRAPEVMEGVPMSTEDTGRIQLQRMTQAGLRVQQLPMLRDIDVPDDAEQVAAATPDSRFASTWRRITG